MEVGEEAPNVLAHGRENRKVDELARGVIQRVRMYACCRASAVAGTLQRCGDNKKHGRSFRATVGLSTVNWHASECGASCNGASKHARTAHVTQE